MHSSRGAVLAEFALIIAFLFVLVGAAIELSRLASEMASLSHVAEEGIAYLLTLPPASQRHSEPELLARSVEQRIADVSHDSGLGAIQAVLERRNNPLQLIGDSIKPEHANRAGKIILDFIERMPEYREQIVAARDENVFNFGK